ncbi:MAG: hypothetical protein ACOX4O_03430 [Eubacteriales bacterium]|jgi:hypothetical protein
MFDMLAICAVIIILLLSLGLDSEVILSKAGAFCIIGGVAALIHILVYTAFRKTESVLPEFVQKLFDDYSPELFSLIYYFLALLAGGFFIYISKKQFPGKWNLTLALSSVFLILTCINMYLWFSFVSVMLFVSSAASVLTAVKQTAARR